MDKTIKTAFSYLRYDIRITWREPSTRIFLFMPLVFFCLLQWAGPALMTAYPDLISWTPLILDGIVFQGGLMFGFVTGFLLLDEKDLDLVTVYRVAPVSFGRFLMLKMVFPFFATWIYAIACLGFNPFLRLSGLGLVVTSFHFALITPMGALLVAALGKNKVEGLTWFKFVDLILIVPFLGFFLPKAWSKLFWIFPTQGVFDALWAWNAGDKLRFWIDHGIGITFLSVLLIFSGYVFRWRLK
jgi:fluoroquinolone transport system permease protein